ncbi:MAG TPA: hypothetical protein PK752_04425 [Accumulibacter sp.]|uniref:hypothetical protein n=1 Tax=Accumulibacter sp. TaxID=2053492 RepID=UPI002CC496C3|nr:hypothetical protein [Accumulibacter sp.]HRD87494.1 hypothetical protein [Accumulibacter sp.]
MSAAAILRETAAAGVTLSLSATGTIKAAGEQDAVARWLTTIKANKAGIVALLAKDTAAAVSWRWLLHFSDRNPLEAAFSPAATHADVLAAYPSALAAEPIEPGRRQTDTLLAGDQEAAVLAWLAAIGEIDQATIDDVLTRCRHDDDARAYYLGRAGYAVTDDDRRRCTECRNLRGAVCVVARPGGRMSAIVGYRPATGILQRCPAFKPANPLANSM